MDVSKTKMNDVILHFNVINQMVSNRNATLRHPLMNLHLARQSFWTPFLILVFLKGGSPSYPPSLLPLSFSGFFFRGVNTHTKAPQPIICNRCYRQRNTIHDRVVQIAQRLRLPSPARRGREEAR